MTGRRALITGITGQDGSYIETLCRVAFGRAGLDYRDHVRVDPKCFRPSDVPFLRGDPSRARAEIGWEATVGFEELILMMVDADLARVAHGRPNLVTS